jgi:predicted DsbA family dithiol-disulfide isomerase
MEAAVHVEIWSDIACPWCYIGKRRFEAALAAFEHADEVTVTWRSFELDPDAPLEREGDRAVHLAAKYGSTVEHAREMQQRMTDVAATEGLDFRFDLARGGTMFDAHRVIHLAKAGGLQDAMEERLFRAYLTEGEVVGDHAVLTRLAVEVGVDEAEVRDLLAGDRHAADVRDDERTGASLGITGVPFFVIDRAMGASGAQPAEVLLDFLQQGWDARPPLAVVADGATCGPDGC